MSSSEFYEWWAYYSIEPFGDLRDDFRIGILDSLVANLMIAEDTEPARPLDFVIHGDAKGKTVLDDDDQADDQAGARELTQAEIDKRVAADVSFMKSTLGEG